MVNIVEKLHTAAKRLRPFRSGIPKPEPESFVRDEHVNSPETERYAGCEEEFPKVISHEPFRSRVALLDLGNVEKRGHNVKNNEAEALKLVQRCAPDVPVPRVFLSSFHVGDDGLPTTGFIYMSFMEGRTLASSWPSLSKYSKERVCRDIWDLISTLRQIPRPSSLSPSAFYITLDGSPFHHPMLGNWDDLCPVIKDDAAFRDRIFARYTRYHGLTYPDGKDVPDMLPRSNHSVFTHGDIHTGNILVDDEGKITGLLDMEDAGFLPDYWEYAQMMRPMGEDEMDWQACMEATKPQDQHWDVTGLVKARRVLF